MSKSCNYEMDAYWNDILKNNFSLKGVGWADWPESYNLILYKKYLKGFDTLIKELGTKHDFTLAKNKKILELGPGVGFYTNYFQAKGITDYTAIDISKTSVENLKEKFPLYNFFQKDISNKDCSITEFKNTFDLICIVDVLLHITDETKHKQAIENISMMLKPGGYLINGDAVTVRQKIDTASDDVSSHNRIIHITDINNLFKEKNLSLVNIYQRYNFLLNANFDFNYTISKKLSKTFFKFVNGSLYLFKSSEFFGKLIGYPLSLLDSAITPFQKEGNNCKFLLYKKSDERIE